MRTIEEYKDRVKTDTLQRLHTVSNLCEVLMSGLVAQADVAPTLRDEGLEAEIGELKEKYLTKYRTAVMAAQGAVHPTTAEVARLQDAFSKVSEYIVSG